jgi:hypothetical protein
VKIKDVLGEAPQPAGRSLADKLMNPQSYQDIVDTSKLRKYGMTKPFEKQFQDSLVAKLQAHLQNPTATPMDDADVVKAYELLKAQNQATAASAQQKIDIAAMANKIRQAHPGITPQQLNQQSGATAFGQMAQQLGANPGASQNPGQTSTGGQVTPTAQGQVHTASPTNPNQPVQPTQATTPVQPTPPTTQQTSVNVPGVGAVTKNPDGHWYDPDGDQIVIQKDIDRLEAMASGKRYPATPNPSAGQWVPDAAIANNLSQTQPEATPRQPRSVRRTQPRRRRE